MRLRYWLSRLFPSLARPPAKLYPVPSKTHPAQPLTLIKRDDPLQPILDIIPSLHGSSSYRPDHSRSRVNGGDGGNGGE